MKKIRVAIYCRVSERDEKRQGSLSNQKCHYEKLVADQPNWKLVDIFSDYGVSGYKDSRNGFKKMIETCHMKKIDLIITKSISRFARNTYSLITTTRELSEIGVNVFFELQNIYTMSAEGELLLTLYAAFAQAESDGARRQTLMSIKRRYEAGNPTRRLDSCLGYTKTPSGDFVPDKDAPTVAMIFEMAASGICVYKITKYLNEKHYRTKRGKRFCRTGVTRILRNPSYMGDFVYQRFYVDETRRLRPNKGERPLYRIVDDHPAIVSREIWEMVQHRLDEASQKAKLKRNGGI